MKNRSELFCLCGKDDLWTCWRLWLWRRWLFISLFLQRIDFYWSGIGEKNTYHETKQLSSWANMSMNDVKFHLSLSQSLSHGYNALGIYIMELMHFSTRYGTKTLETKQRLRFWGYEYGPRFGPFPTAPSFTYSNLKTSYDEQRQIEVFLKDGLPNMNAVAFYVVMSFISTMALSRIFPQLKWYYILACCFGLWQLSSQSSL